MHICILVYTQLYIYILWINNVNIHLYVELKHWFFSKDSFFSKIFGNIHVCPLFQTLSTFCPLFQKVDPLFRRWIHFSESGSTFSKSGSTFGKVDPLFFKVQNIFIYSLLLNILNFQNIIDLNNLYITKSQSFRKADIHKPILLRETKSSNRILFISWMKLHTGTVYL
jgi:hypothetical protein